MTDQRCGVIAIVGRPNVGKSTLLNHLLGQKLSITSRKPQTTRNQVLGVSTQGRTQLIFVDTPGLHLGQSKAINKMMNKAAASALTGVDLTLLLCDRTKWTAEDDYVLDVVSRHEAPVALVINKTDLLRDRDELLPFVEALSARCRFDAVLPVSALRARGLEELTVFVEAHAPVGPHLFRRIRLRTGVNASSLLSWSEKKSSGKWETSCLMRQQSKSNPSPTTSEVYSTSALSFW